MKNRRPLRLLSLLLLSGAVLGPAPAAADGDDALVAPENQPDQQTPPVTESKASGTQPDSDPNNPANIVAALLQNPEAGKDVGERVFAFLWAQDHPFVTDEARKDSGFAARTKAGVQAWCAKEGNSCARIYAFLGCQGKAPAWAADEKTQNAVKGVGREDELVDAMKTWLQSNGKGPAALGDKPEWIEAFLVQAAEEAKKLLYPKKDAKTLRSELDKNARKRPGWNPPGGAGAGVGVKPLPGRTEKGYDEEALFGRKGDPNVVLIDGRWLSFKIYTEKGADGKLVEKLGVFDITTPSDIYGREFDLTYDSDKPFVLGKAGQKQYLLSFVPDGKDTKIVFKRPDGSEPSGDNSGEIPSVNDLYRLRARQAVENGDMLAVGDKIFYILPQASKTGGYDLFPESLKDNLDAPDPRDLRPELVTYLNQRVNGHNENISDKNELGAVGDKFYYMVYDKGAAAWSVQEGPAPAPKAPGGGGPDEPGTGPDQPGPPGANGCPGIETDNPKGKYTSGPAVDGLNGKMAADVAVALCVDADQTEPDRRYMLVNKDAKLGMPLPYAGKMKIIGGDVLALTSENEQDVEYVNLRQRIGQKTDNIVGEFHKAEGVISNVVSGEPGHEIRDVMAVLQDAMERAKFSPGARKLVKERAEKIIGEKQVPKGEYLKPDGGTNEEAIKLPDGFRYSFDGNAKTQAIELHIKGFRTFGLHPKKTVGPEDKILESDRKLAGKGKVAMDSADLSKFEQFPPLPQPEDSVYVTPGKEELTVFKKDGADLQSSTAVLYKSSKDGVASYHMYYKIEVANPAAEGDKFQIQDHPAVVFQEPPQPQTPWLGPPKDWDAVKLRGLKYDDKDPLHGPLQVQYVPEYVKQQDKLSYDKGAIGVYNGTPNKDGKFEHCLGVILTWGGLSFEDAEKACRK